MILKDLSSLRPRTVFCMMSFAEKIFLGAQRIQESGSTTFQILRQISSHIFHEHSKFVEI